MGGVFAVRPVCVRQLLMDAAGSAREAPRGRCSQGSKTVLRDNHRTAGPQRRTAQRRTAAPQRRKAGPQRRTAGPQRRTAGPQRSTHFSAGFVIRFENSKRSSRFSRPCRFVACLCELRESRGGRPGLPSLISRTVSVDVKQHFNFNTHRRVPVLHRPQVAVDVTSLSLN